MYCNRCSPGSIGHLQSYDLETTPTEYNNKIGWYKTHNNHNIIVKRLLASVLLSTELWHPWRQQNTFCGGQRIYLFPQLLNMLCVIVAPDALINIGKVFQQKSAADVSIILEGLLPRDFSKSKKRNKILKENNYLKKSCKDETNIYYLEQDRNWVHKDQLIDTSLYYKLNQEMIGSHQKIWKC